MFVINWSVFSDRPYRASLVLESKAREPTQVKHLSGAPLLGIILTLPTNIRLGCKGLLVTNTLAYYKHSYITGVNFFVTLGP